MAPVTCILIGAGSRGSVYAEYARAHPDELRLVAVAEPRDAFRERVARAHSLTTNQAVTDWRELAGVARIADAAIIATPDAEHAPPAVAFAEAGYHLLLEKPLAPSEADCEQIVAAVERTGVIFALSLVLRYTPYTQKLKELLDSGYIGEIVSVQHLEPVGFWHHAHAFVRGNWRREALASSMLLAKSCHDLDWLRYLVGEPCVAVASFGANQHFHPAAAPPGAAAICLDCPVEPACPYSAPRIYLDLLGRKEARGLLDALTLDQSPPGILRALRHGPYGRCVYRCDNDVVDHQVVSMAFAGGASAVFTMTGFTRQRPRETRIFGTRGEIFGDGRTIDSYDFLTGRSEQITVDAPSTDHLGGDPALIRRFLAAVASGDQGQLLATAAETLESHLLVFAAETARRERRTVHLSGGAAPRARAGNGRQARAGEGG